MQYFFILGRQPELSIAELEAIFKRDKITNKRLCATNEFAVFELKQKINPQELLQRLGGTIKIGEIVARLHRVSAGQATNLSATIKSLLPQTDKKIIFGINDYTGKNKPINLSKQIKKEIEQPARFVYPQQGEKYLSSVAAEKNKLLTESGAEFNLFPLDASQRHCKSRHQRDAAISNSSLVIGRTLAVQPFEKFSKFDFDRPNKDAESGMLPPKVATIMLNLSEAKKTATILDPFCGSGTILQQAALLGFEKILGSDFSKKAVEDSQKNINWLEQQTNRQFNVEITELDARTLSDKIAKNSIDAIVTEPFLGKPLWGNESLNIIKQQISELEIFYAEILEHLAAVLKKNGTLVIIVPTFNIKQQTFNLNLEKILGKSNLKIVGSWQYARPNQHVIRNIYKLGNR
ncbi:methyltransferase domain-containing protein [Candidatus Falkowbacteria bacterium]|nr:methyltransferase domain-containing protein [Candidatus Falkowbacteria bacterium]